MGRRAELPEDVSDAFIEELRRLLAAHGDVKRATGIALGFPRENAQAQIYSVLHPKTPGARPRVGRGMADRICAVLGTTYDEYVARLRGVVTVADDAARWSRLIDVVRSEGGTLDDAQALMDAAAKDGETIDEAAVRRFVSTRRKSASPGSVVTSADAFPPRKRGR